MSYFQTNVKNTKIIVIWSMCSTKYHFYWSYIVLNKDKIVSRVTKWELACLKKKMLKKLNVKFSSNLANYNAKYDQYYTCESSFLWYLSLQAFWAIIKEGTC